MNDNFYFKSIQPVCGTTLNDQLQSVEEQLYKYLLDNGLTGDYLEHTKIYLSDAANQWEDVKQHSLYKSCLAFGSVSYIEQPILPGFKVAVLLMFRKEHMVKSGTPDCRFLTIGNVRYIYHSVRFKAEEVQGRSAQWQTEEAFRRHIAQLDKEGLTLKDNCHRTWIYVRDVDVNYAGVVNGRNNIFNEEGLTSATHFIASTGIGGNPDNREACVGIDFFSIDGVQAVDAQYLQALDYLNPTYEYGVAFERGVALPLPEAKMLLVSGTASIDCKGEVLYKGDVLKQTERLFLNIEKLLNDGGAVLKDMCYIIVYLRDIADYNAVKSYIDGRFPGLPALYLEARVCRPDWLIEVEGIALAGKS